VDYNDNEERRYEIEEKEEPGRPAAFFLPSYFGHMKTNSEIVSAQAHLEEVFQEVVQSWERSRPVPPEFPTCSAGLGQMLAATLNKEREFYLNDHGRPR
jgi:hypothetical protein